ncbi:MAG: acyl-CoA dehydrogenase, partial [Acidimicrobiales bacterium]
MNAPTLSAATAAVSTMEAVVDAALGRLAIVDIDEHQVVAYDIAHGAAAVASARNLLGYGAHGEAEERLTVAFVADVAHDLATRLLGREADWGVERGALDGIHDFMAAGRAPELLASLIGGAPSHLDEDMQLASDTFR